MGTLFTFKAAVAVDGPAVAAALDTVAWLEGRLSNWRATSELSRLNAADGADVSAPLRAVLDSALALASLTSGAFDPTVEPLTLAWGLRGEARVPSARVLATARARVGWRRVCREGARVSLGGAALDLGGIGKGFALDRAAQVLRGHGVRSARLDAGGQLLVLGNTACSAWVAHPEKRDTPAVRIVLREGSLATSAQSERGARAHGRWIGHVLDPRSGQPVATRASVSVWAPNGTRADALSTALLVMGRAGAAEFAERHPSLGVLWLEPGGRGVRRLRADAWNLDVAEAAPDVALTLHPPLCPTSLTGTP